MGVYFQIVIFVHLILNWIRVRTAQDFGCTVTSLRKLIEMVQLVEIISPITVSDLH